MSPAPVLVLGVGNPSRGDDALGPALIERAAELLAGEVSRGELELLTEFQLQPEHAMDLVGRTRVIFVDASERAPAPFSFDRVAALRDASVSTHAMSPGAVLAALRDALHERPPEAWVLAIRGERFELGEGLSPHAVAHLDAAVAFLVEAIRGAQRDGRRFELEGTVQGVGFRPWALRAATRLGLHGSVWNTPRGAEIEAFGPGESLDALMRAFTRELPRAATVRSVRITPLDPREVRGFTIAESQGTDGAGSIALPPDLAACDACLREVDDPADRRHGYVFTSCVDCGPRFSLARALPFDRARTTMAGFAMCLACAREYRTLEDRRLHAETLACEACGPRVWMVSVDGVPRAAQDLVGDAAKMLCDGWILGVQGLGAFHLVCDATHTDALATLRRRKGRDAQPFAVMVPDLLAAETLVHLDDALRDALMSPARPIVLAPTRADAPFAVEAVNGRSRRTGVMLPYTPLHHRLARSLARPMVVTSFNLHDSPAVIEHAEALRVAPSLADFLVLHDRPIARRVEDSVVGVGFQGVRVIRRARGFVPRAIRLPAAAPVPLLAVGGHMKNTACLVVDDLAYLTSHLGDLDSFESEQSWAREVEGMERLLGIRAEVLAHDLHPDYATTRYALSRTASRRVAVQHHVAHAMAALAEHRVEEPVIAVAYDGTGFGTDGTSWGGEVLLIDGARWTRVSALRAIPLPGGERAIREVWRVALGALVDALGPDDARSAAEELPVFAGVAPEARETVVRMAVSGVSTPPVRGVGRYFDAVGALTLNLPRAGFDGHVAVALEEEADASADAYPFAAPSSIDPGDALGPEREMDLRPALRAVVADLRAGVAPSVIAARFHACIVELTATVVARALAETGLRRVVLCGGAMQNRALERGLIARLGEDRVVMAREVPLNDGGLSLGQAWFATLALRGEGA